MAASIDFYAGENFALNSLAGSGLGFYGDNGFGQSVTIAAYQGNTYITNSNGTSQGSLVDNVKYLNAQSGIVGSEGSGRLLTTIPNYLSTLKISFTNDTAVTTSNAKVYIFDRVDKNNDPSGVTCQVAEVIHPNTVFDNTGSGDSTWTHVHGSAVILDLVDSPGLSGLSPNGAQTSSTRHDWFVNLSASPDSVGSKTNFGLFLQLEYL